MNIKPLQCEDWLTRIVGAGVQFVFLLFLSYLGIACLQIQNLALQPLPLWKLQGADRLPERTPNLLGDLPLEMRSAGHVIKT